MTEAEKEVLKLRAQLDALTSIVVNMATMLPDRGLAILAQQAKVSSDTAEVVLKRDDGYAF